MEKININSRHKAWLLGVDESKSPIEIAYGTKKDYDGRLPHKHEKVHEYYIIIKGTGKLCINNIETTLKEGDVIYIEPGEIHNIESISEDFQNYTIKWPHLPKDKIIIK